MGKNENGLLGNGEKEKKIKEYFRNVQGITLVALVVTIVVLLILAGISIGVMTGKNGIFSKAEQATEQYEQSKAREMLEIALSGARIEKYTNKQYNENKFLDKYIIDQIKGAEIRGDVAIIGKYAFELDRSVPKIDRDLGLEKDLVFPTVTVSEVTLSEDVKSATFTITASEEIKGINRIEIWLSGVKLETIQGNNEKTVTKPYTATRNGEYTIKVYADLSENETVNVAGIVPAVEFTPNGNTEWKKQHQTKITVRETGEKVTSVKYLWTTNGSKEPAISEFKEECTNNCTITGGNATMTGTYFLWILLTTETGEKSICGSEGFNFDNEGPQITIDNTQITLERGEKGSFTANIVDNGVGIIEGYFLSKDGNLKIDEENFESITWEECSNGEVTVEIIETDEPVEITYYLWAADSIGNISNKKSIKVTVNSNYLVDKVKMGDYVDIGVSYTGQMGSNSGWRVLRTEGKNKTGCVYLLSAGAPLTFYHVKPVYASNENGSFRILGDLWKEIPSGGGQGVGKGFVNSGFSGRSFNIPDVFKNAKGVDTSYGSHTITSTEIGEITRAYSGGRAGFEGNKAWRFTQDNDLRLMGSDKAYCVGGGSSYNDYYMYVCNNWGVSSGGYAEYGVRMVLKLVPGLTAETPFDGRGSSLENAWTFN